jgi:hypothetical protein
MAEWVHVENNEVKGQYDLLPNNWKNVSGLNLAKEDLPFLKSLGWYPVTKQTEDYNNTTHTISSYNYEIRENDVYETYTLEEINKPVLNFDILKNNFMIELRNKRNKKLIESDWTQGADVQQSFNEEKKSLWKFYRQQLRDITQIYLNNDVVDINSVNWPQPHNSNN